MRSSMPRAEADRSYKLHARSYKCEEEVIVMMAQQPEMVSMMSTATDIEAPISILGSE